VSFVRVGVVDPASVADYEAHGGWAGLRRALSLTPAEVVQEVMPDAELLGPALCCWYDYWNIAPGPQDDGEEDFLAWFLDGVRAHDTQTGTRSLDYLDVHFYPQSGVYNDDVDEETSARRLRSTQALWNPAYRDESWIPEAINFIPRMREVIAAHYPDTKLFISEWSFGAENTMNGALAIADVLGIYGRAGVEGATYYRNPQPGSPGFLAFTLFGDYDGSGSWFGGRSVTATNSDDVAAARDAVAHLLSLGRRRIAAIGDQPYATGEAAQLRTQGFRVAHAEAGLPVDESLVIQTARFNRADGARAMQRLLDRDDHPDAVFCFSDLVAAGAIHTILERGLRVPEDIAIIGYDDIEEGRYTRPTISTISQDKAAIAQLAVERLMLRISSSTPVPGVELLAQHRLRARQSTLGVAGALAERDRGRAGGDCPETLLQQEEFGRHAADRPRAD
jgi:hypothetical protein